MSAPRERKAGAATAAAEAREPSVAEKVVEAAGALFGEQAREQAAEDLAQGQGDRWLEATDADAADDADEAGW